MDKAARSLAFALALLVLGTPPGTAWARAGKVDAEVTRLSKEAHALYKAGKHQEAAQLLLKAYELKPVPELIFNVARSLDEGGAFEDSLRYYQRYIDLDGAEPELVKRASRALERVGAEVAKKKEAERVAAAAAAEEERRKRDAASAAAAGPIGIGATAGEPGGPAAASAPPSPWVYVAGGVAATGLIAGVGLGLSASSAKEQLSATDELGAKQTLARSAEGRALGADIGYGVAAVGAGLAAWLLFSPPASAPAVALGPSGATATFSFGP